MPVLFPNMSKGADEGANFIMLEPVDAVFVPLLNGTGFKLVLTGMDPGVCSLLKVTDVVDGGVILANVEATLMVPLPSGTFELEETF